MTKEYENENEANQETGNPSGLDDVTLITVIKTQIEHLLRFVMALFNVKTNYIDERVLLGALSTNFNKAKQTDIRMKAVVAKDLALYTEEFKEDRDGFIPVELILKVIRKYKNERMEKLYARLAADGLLAIAIIFEKSTLNNVMTKVARVLGVDREDRNIFHDCLTVKTDLIIKVADSYIVHNDLDMDLCDASFTALFYMITIDGEEVRGASKYIPTEDYINLWEVLIHRMLTDSPISEITHHIFPDVNKVWLGCKDVTYDLFDIEADSVSFVKDEVGRLKRDVSLIKEGTWSPTGLLPLEVLEFTEISLNTKSHKIPIDPIVSVNFSSNILWNVGEYLNNPDAKESSMYEAFCEVYCADSNKFRNSSISQKLKYFSVNVDALLDALSTDELVYMLDRKRIKITDESLKLIGNLNDLYMSYEQAMASRDGTEALLALMSTEDYDLIQRILSIHKNIKLDGHHNWNGFMGMYLPILDNGHVFFQSDKKAIFDEIFYDSHTEGAINDGDEWVSVNVSELTQLPMILCDPYGLVGKRIFKLRRHWYDNREFVEELYHYIMAKQLFSDKGMYARVGGYHAEDAAFEPEFYLRQKRTPISPGSERALMVHQIHGHQDLHFTLNKTPVNIESVIDGSGWNEGLRDDSKHPLSEAFDAKVRKAVKTGGVSVNDRSWITVKNWIPIRAILSTRLNVPKKRGGTKLLNVPVGIKELTAVTCPRLSNEVKDLFYRYSGLRSMYHTMVYTDRRLVGDAAKLSYLVGSGASSLYSDRMISLNTYLKNRKAVPSFKNNFWPVLNISQVYVNMAANLVKEIREMVLLGDINQILSCDFRNHKVYERFHNENAEGFSAVHNLIVRKMIEGNNYVHFSDELELALFNWAANTDMGVYLSGLLPKQLVLTHGLKGGRV